MKAIAAGTSETRRCNEGRAFRHALHCGTAACCPQRAAFAVVQYTQIALRPIVAWFFFAIPLSSTNGALSDVSYRPSARTTRLLPNLKAGVTVNSFTLASPMPRRVPPLSLNVSARRPRENGVDVLIFA